MTIQIHVQWGGPTSKSSVLHQPGLFHSPSAGMNLKKDAKTGKPVRWVWNHQAKQTWAACSSCVCCSVLDFNGAWSTFDHMLMNIARCRITLPSNFLGLDHCDFCSVACRPVLRLRPALCAENRKGHPAPKGHRIAAVINRRPSQEIVGKKQDGWMQAMEGEGEDCAEEHVRMLRQRHCIGSKFKRWPREVCMHTIGYVWTIYTECVLRGDMVLLCPFTAWAISSRQILARHNLKSLMYALKNRWVSPFDPGIPRFPSLLRPVLILLFVGTRFGLWNFQKPPSSERWKCSSEAQLCCIVLVTISVYLCQCSTNWNLETNLLHFNGLANGKSWNIYWKPSFLAPNMGFLFQISLHLLGSVCVRKIQKAQNHRAMVPSKWFEYWAAHTACKLWD